MKKTVLLLIGVCLAVGANGYAASKEAKKQAPQETGKKAWSRPYGMAGCGLGLYVVGKRGNQILAATTNSTAYNQSFGITFGTLNCIDDPNVKIAARMDNFVAANKVALAGDIARGNGETLDSLLSMMGCEGNVGSSIQKNFNEIFPSADVTPNEVTDSLITVIKNDQALVASCKQIS